MFDRINPSSFGETCWSFPAMDVGLRLQTIRTEREDDNTVFGLGVFSIAGRHALVSLRHAALFLFFFRITIITFKEMRSRQLL